MLVEYNWLVHKAPLTKFLVNQRCMYSQHHGNQSGHTQPTHRPDLVVCRRIGVHHSRHCDDSLLGNSLHAPETALGALKSTELGICHGVGVFHARNE